MSARKTAMFTDRTDRWGLVEGDALALLPKLPDDVMDVVITDPPYGLGFNGAPWDRHADFASWTQRWARDCVRILKPGGHLVAFGAPRTFHRLACGIEDAGLEIRDTLIWLHAPGIPKSRRLPGGLSRTLAPAYEPILLARAPFTTTLPYNLAAHNTGALGIEAAATRGPAEPDRWPSNTLLSHAAPCRPRGCAGECPIGMLNTRHSRNRPSRFFYCPKASTAERETGCDELAAQPTQVYIGGRGRPRQARNIHPTVKPLELMRWLVRLTCPPGGIVLDPFTGSGSTGAAAMREDRRFLGIEREGAFIDVACARITHWAQQPHSDGP